MASHDAAHFAALTPEVRRRFVQYFGCGRPQGYRMWVQEHLVHPVQVVLEGVIPDSLRTHYVAAQELEALLGRDQDELQLSLERLPLLRRAALHYRYELALQQERLHTVNADADHATAIDELSREVDTDLAAPWLVSIPPLPRPTLTDFVNLKSARAILAQQNHGQVPQRSYDEKFGILWPPSALHQLLQACRTENWLLRTGTTVAFLDIDDFKKVNSSLSETVVDRTVLPKLMLILEAHTSQHGYAIRQGGDEYIVILPNSTNEGAVRAMAAIRAAVCEVFTLPPKITLSIGCVYVASDCTFTNTQILLEANRAKNEAKEQGKDRVVFRLIAD